MHSSESLLSIVTIAWLPNADATTDILLYLLLLNARACILLAGCLFMLRLTKGSASTRHFLIAVSVIAIALLPLTSRLIPAFDVVIETPYLQEIGAAETVDAMPVTNNRETDLFTPELIYSGCLGIYFLGMAVILTKVLLGNVKLFLLVRLCRPVTQQRWLNALGEYRGNMGIRRRVELRHSDLNVSPSTWGGFRPVILLPSGALQWPDHLIESTLLHELAHIKRCDWFVQQIVRCVYAFYWLNPLCRVAVNKLFAHAEIACDDLAINAGVSNLDYAESLVDVAEQVLQHRRYGYAAAIAMASHCRHSPLSERVLAILNRHECRTPITRTQILTALSVFLCVLLPLTSVRANFVERTVEPLQPATFENHVYTPRNANDHTRAIPVDILTMENIEKTGLDESADSVTPERRLAELKQILEAGTAPDVAETTDKKISGFARDPNTLPKRAKPPGLASISANEILKDHLEKTLNKIAQTLVDRPSVVNTAAEPTAIVSHSPVNMVIPEYPFRARSRGIEGEVTVEYSIDEHGKVVDAEIVSSPSSLFNRHVMKAIKNSTFLPRMVNGKPVPAEGLIEKYVFVLET